MDENVFFDFSGARSYLINTAISFYSEIIDKETFDSRLEFFIENFCYDSSEMQNHINRLLEAYSQKSNKEGIRHTVNAFPPPDKAELSQWDIHKYDPDPFPSVPHGHHKQKNNKLDAYLGWIYDGNERIDRESRIKIIKMWNDNDFRKEAYEALDYFITKNPKI